MASNSVISPFKCPARPLMNGSAQSQKMLEFRVKLLENCTILCQSSGRETILDMVKAALAKKQMTKNIEFMMFRSSKGYFLNLGKPTGTLQQDDEYQCIFKEKLKEKTVDSIRDYRVQDFEEKWNIKSFHLKLSKKRNSQPPIGNITRIADVIQVDFFPEETLFEALCRDNRLTVSNKDELIARKWKLKLNDGTEVPLGNKAESCEGKYFELFKSNNLDPELPTFVLPKRKPAEVIMDGKKDDVTSVVQLNPLSVTPVRPCRAGRRGEVVDHSASYTKRTYKFCSDADLKDYIQSKLRFTVQKKDDNKAEKERANIIKKFFKTYDNFASRYKHHIDLAEVNALSDAVGTVRAQVVSDVEMNIGTCFRVGSEYVITNRHVVNEYYAQPGVKNVYIDFTGCSCKQGVKRFKAVMKPVCSSTDLDYAILKLCHNDVKLPSSITSHGYHIPQLNQCIIPGKFLTLIGYPGGSNKAVDVTCPIANPGNLDKNVIFTLSRRNAEYVSLNNNATQTVDVSSLSHGLSGSPCLLRNEKLLMGLYCRGFHLQDNGDSVVEQGVLMFAIVEDVRQKIRKGYLPTGITLKELFDIDQK